LETDDDEDTDTQGVGLSRRGSRFVSDSLTFTGTDLGDHNGGLRRRQYQESDSEEGDGSSTDLEEDEDSLAMLDPRDREEILVQSAMARIERAQAKGRTDVNLTKGELEALEQRKKRQAEEAEKKERRKRRERIAVPLTQLEPVSRKKKSGRSSELSSRHPSASDLTQLQLQERQVMPPMGHFPPPAGSRTRPRSGTAASQRPVSHLHEEYGAYDHVQRPSSAANNRHASDPTARPRSARGHIGDDANSPVMGGPNSLDPFQFQTEGPRSSVAAASRRPMSGSAEVLYRTRPEAGAPSAARSSRSHRRSMYEESSDEEFIPSEDGSSVSDDAGHGARIREVPRGRESIVVEESPEPEREQPKKKESSPVKRKPVPSRGKKKKR
jgi:PRA1 family protein 1